jgi:hypothetical protein
MGLSHSPQIVLDQLTLYLDPANPRTFSEYTTSSSLISNGNFSGGLDVTGVNPLDHNPDNGIIKLNNPTNSHYVLQQSGNYPEYQINLYSQMVANTTYVMSGWYGKSSDYTAYDTMFHSRAFSASGNHIATDPGLGTTLKTVVVDGITWRYGYLTITTPSDYSNVFNWYLGYGQPAPHSGKRYYTGLKIEKGTMPSSYDLSSNNANAETINASYSSNNSGTFTLNGSSAYLNIPNFKSIFPFNTAFTISAWINPTNSSSVDIVSCYNYAANDGVWLELHSASNQIRFVSRQIGTAVFDLTSSETIGTGQWKNIVATFDGITAKIYIDGVQSVNTSSSSTLFSITNTDLNIGRIDPILGRYLAGSIGPVMIYKKAISSTEVSTNFNALKGRYGL